MYACYGNPPMANSSLSHQLIYPPSLSSLLLTTRGSEDPAANNMPRSPDKAGCSLRAVPQPLHTNQPASNLLSVLSQTLLGYMSRVCACPQIKRSSQYTPGRAEAMREGNPRLPSPWWRSSTNIKCVPLKGAIRYLKIDCAPYPVRDTSGG